jgi:hypothetical protein
MEILITIALIFVVGIITVKIFQITKNIIYVLVVIFVGWCAFNFVLPRIIPMGEGTIVDQAEQINEEVVEKVIDSIDKDGAAAGKKIGESVTNDLNELYEEAKKGEGTDSWDIDKNNDGETDAIDRFIHSVKNIFR